MRTLKLEASSSVMLVTSISARKDSPSADCTARRPKPKARTLGVKKHSDAAATPVSAKRPAFKKFLFKASPMGSNGWSAAFATTARNIGKKRR